MRQSGRRDHLPRREAGVPERVEQVQEAALRQVVAGELLGGRAAEQTEVGGGPQEARRHAIACGVGPLVLGDPAALAERSR